MISFIVYFLIILWFGLWIGSFIWAIEWMTAKNYHGFFKIIICSLILALMLSPLTSDFDEHTVIIYYKNNKCYRHVSHMAGKIVETVPIEVMCPSDKY